VLSQVKQQKWEVKMHVYEYVKYDTCLNSSYVDAILFVFADFFRKKANERKTFPCAVAWNITSCEFPGSTTHLGE